MDSGVKVKLTKWVRQQVGLLDDERGACKKFVLRHVASGKVGSELGLFKVPKKPGDDSWIVELVDSIESQVSDDAEGLGGIQTYVVFPYFENTDKPGSRFTIRETAINDDPEDVESEPPTKTGILSQMMRHTEAATRASLMSMGQIVTTLRNANARQAELIEKLLSEKMSGLETMERLKSQELERRLVVQREERDQKMKAELLDKASTLIPVLVNRIAGKKLLPGGTRSPVESMIQGLLETIDGEQMENLQKVLKPTQLVTLLEIFQSLQPQANNSVPSGTENPDAHA